MKKCRVKSAWLIYTTKNFKIDKGLKLNQQKKIIHKKDINTQKRLQHDGDRQTTK